jgi:hypothetical protein
MTRQVVIAVCVLGSLALAGSFSSAQPPPVPGYPPPPDAVVPPKVERPLTIFEFAKVVKPLPGKHEVLLCHPYTGQPIRVCFTLPPGCPKVILRKKLLCYEIDFDYGRFEVELNFGCRGRFRVDLNK